MNRSIFHVHSFRCGHAEEISDECYVKKAIELGATDIWFTDHAPFPDDPFGHRMAYSQLEEYLQTLSELKKQYHEINIHIGLEIEYVPSYDKTGFYDRLRSVPEIEMLLLGQHLAEIPGDPVKYSFSESEEYLRDNEYKLLGNAMIQGIKTGYFDVIAHPDRIFRKCSAWDEETEKIASEIVNAAVCADIPLEKNISSLEDPKNYKCEFWRLAPENAKCVVGLDAHSLNEMEARYRNLEKSVKRFDE